MKKIIIDEQRLASAKRIGIAFLVIWIIVCVALFLFDLAVFYAWIVGSLSVFFLLIYLFLRAIEKR